MKICIENLTKKISKNVVLDNINLDLFGGNIYGFVGRNGSGKTMLMRAICGLILPSQGCVKIDDKIIGKDMSFPPNAGVLIEYPGFISSYSGFKNLKIISSIQKKISDEDIRKAMIEVGLNPDEKKNYRKYSLGMKQKLGIAAAVMENPKLLILDEPFNALDEESVNKVRNIILEKSNEDNIIIISCHDYEEINMLCNKIIKLDSGKVVNIRENFIAV